MERLQEAMINTQVLTPTGVERYGAPLVTAQAPAFLKAAGDGVGGIRLFHAHRGRVICVQNTGTGNLLIYSHSPSEMIDDLDPFDPYMLGVGQAVTFVGGPEFDWTTILGGGANSGHAFALSVTDFGAVPDGITDSTDAIQACVDFALLTGISLARIFFPWGTGSYNITAPIMVRGHAVPSLIGSTPFGANNGTQIYSSGYVGPSFHISGPNPPSDLTFTTSLATGPGKAVVTAAATMSSDTFLDFVDAAGATQFNGLAQLSIQCFLKMTSLPGGGGCYILTSYGSLTDFNPLSAFALGFDSSGHLNGGINVNGTLTSMQSSATLTPNQIYYVELSYDGAHTRLFYGIPGATTTLVAATATTGPVSQGMFEQMSLGGARQNYPHGPALVDCMNGALDSIQFSNVARHTAAFTAPTVKHVQDSHTLLLENFDNETGDFSIVQGLGGSIYLNKYGQNGEQGSLGEIADLAFYNAGGQSGLHLTATTAGWVHDCAFQYGLYGINSGKDIYTNRFQRLSFGSVGDSTSRAGFVMASQAGINHYEDIRWSGYPVHFIGGSGGGEFSTCYFTGGDAIMHLVLRVGQWHLNSLSFSNEDNPAATMVSNIFIANAALVLTNCDVERYANAGPAITVGAGCTTITMLGSRFRMNAGATSVISLLSTTTNPIARLNCLKDQSGVIWGDETIYANRPTAPQEGDTQVFTDSNTATWAATIAGTGSSRVQGRFNGTNWTVAAK